MRILGTHITETKLKIYKMEANKMALNLSRQSKLVPEEALTTWNIEVFGVGSIGSHVAMLLAKTGFQNIRVYDMDKVEEENLGPQAFTFKHLKMLKTEAIKEAIKEAADIEIATVDGQITDKYEITPEPNTIYLCFFDSFEGRKMIYEKVKDFPVIFVDGRIGRFEMRHYLTDCSIPEEKVSYEKSFPKGEGSELVCGEKASAMINYEIAGKIVNNVVNYVAGRDYDRIFIGDSSEPSNNIHIRKEVKKGA